MKYSLETDSILMSIYKTGSINRDQLSPSVLHDLFQNKHITNSNDYHDNNIYLTDSGKAYVEELKKEQTLRIHNWINTVIAFGALVVAILAYIKQ